MCQTNWYSGKLRITELVIATQSMVLQLSYIQSNIERGIMTIKSGFFNSLNHDRMYDADDMNAIFDGIITDGVFGNIGNRFIVTPGSGMTINIGTGKARLHQIFVENDADLVLQVSQSECVIKSY